jgi:hypothetical protein
MQLSRSTQSKNENQFSINNCYKGYNRKEYKSNMRPAVLLDGNIHTHIYETTTCPEQRKHLSVQTQSYEI